MLAPLLLAAACAAAPPTPTEVQRAARRLIEHSRIADKKGVRLVHYAPDVDNTDLEGKPVRGVPPPLRGAPAGSMNRGSVDNPLGVDLIYTTPALWNYVSDATEAAMIMSHEVAHLELQHGVKYEAAFCALFREWKKKKDAPCPAKSKEYKRFRLANPWVKERMLGLERQNEYEADERGMRIAMAAGYDVRAYVTLMEAAAEVHRSPGWTDDGSHPDPSDRIGHLKATALPEAMSDHQAF